MFVCHHSYFLLDEGVFWCAPASITIHRLRVFPFIDYMRMDLRKVFEIAFELFHSLTNWINGHFGPQSYNIAIYAPVSSLNQSIQRPLRVSPQRPSIRRIEIFPLRSNYQGIEICQLP